MYHYDQGCDCTKRVPGVINLVKWPFAMAWVSVRTGLSRYHQQLCNSIHKMRALVTVQLTCLHHHISYCEFSLSEIVFDQDVEGLKIDIA